MARTKTIVRRWSQVLIPLRIGNQNILNRFIRNIPFRVKMTLSQSKSVNVKKPPPVVRRMNVRQKAVYFSQIHRLNFVYICCHNKTCRDKNVSIVKVSRLPTDLYCN